MGSFISAQLGITDAKLCLGGPRLVEPKLQEYEMNKSGNKG